MLLFVYWNLIARYYSPTVVLVYGLWCYFVKGWCVNSKTPTCSWMLFFSWNSGWVLSDLADSSWPAPWVLQKCTPEVQLIVHWVGAKKECLPAWEKKKKTTKPKRRTWVTNQLCDVTRAFLLVHHSSRCLSTLSSVSCVQRKRLN